MHPSVGVVALRPKPSPKPSCVYSARVGLITPTKVVFDALRLRQARAHETTHLPQPGQFQGAANNLHGGVMRTTALAAAGAVQGVLYLFWARSLCRRTGQGPGQTQRVRDEKKKGKKVHGFQQVPQPCDGLTSLVHSRTLHLHSRRFFTSNGRGGGVLNLLFLFLGEPSTVNWPCPGTMLNGSQDWYVSARRRRGFSGSFLGPALPVQIFDSYEHASTPHPAR